MRPRLTARTGDGAHLPRVCDYYFLRAFVLAALFFFALFFLFTGPLALNEIPSRMAFCCTAAGVRPSMAAAARAVAPCFASCESLRIVAAVQAAPSLEGRFGISLLVSWVDESRDDTLCCNARVRCCSVIPSGRRSMLRARRTRSVHALFVPGAYWPSIPPQHPASLSCLQFEPIRTVATDPVALNRRGV